MQGASVAVASRPLPHLHGYSCINVYRASGLDRCEVSCIGYLFQFTSLGKVELYLAL